MKLFVRIGWYSLLLVHIFNNICRCIASTDSIPYQVHKGGASNTWTWCLRNLIENNLVTDFTFTPQDERDFLIKFYHETGGPTYWKNSLGWGDNNTHHCHWFGIQCYPNDTYVKWIDMTRNNLVGTPRNLWKFRNIQGLCLSANREMTGRLSDIVFGNMTRLRQLCVSYSGLYGRIPWKALLKLENLEKIQICCTNNGLKGNIPQNIGRLNKLQVLSIGSNNIKGAMPKSINNLTKLWYLDLGLVKFTSGDLSYFSNLPNLIYIDITNCGLKGKIPKHFSTTHPHLIELLFKGNMLEGKIEDLLDGLENLHFLHLRKNRMGGLLPRMLGNLTKLKLLDLSHNDFIGLEENLAFNQNLEYLFLSDNVNLKTDISTMLRAIEPCKNLHIFNASNCSLQGQFSYDPVYLGPITNLDLGTNNLTGRIPSFRGRRNNFAELDSLVYLSLASNQLVGSIPAAFLGYLQNLNYLDIRQNSNLRAANLAFFQLKMKPNYEVAIRTRPNNNFSCPSFHLYTSSGEVYMDPSYYNYSLCTCDKGFYGYGNHCLPCMRGGVCKKETQFPSTVAVEEKFSKEIHLEIKMTITKGYWPCCEGFGDVQRLIECEMNEVSQTEVCSPSEDCQCTAVQASPHQTQPKTTCNSSCVCRFENTGRFCSQCITGYYKKGAVCTKCPSFLEIFPFVMTAFFIACFLMSVVLLTCCRSYKRVTLVVMILLLTTMAVLHITTATISGWFFILIFVTWIVGLSNERAKLQSFVAIAVFYFQSLDAILSEAKIWPASVILLKYKITSVFNFDLARFTCRYDWNEKPEKSFWVLPVLSAAAVIVVWLLHFVVNAVGRRCIIQRSTCKRTTIHVLLLVYFPITKKTFSAISQCVHRDGLSYLKNTPWLDCGGSSYHTLLIEGYIFLGVFVICIPLFVLAPLLYKNLGENGKPLSEAIDIWLGPLYKIYVDRYRRYFPLLFLSRRLLLAAFLSLIPSTSSFQILSITAVLVVFVIIDLIARPFKQSSEKFQFENASDILVCVVLLLSFVGLATLRSSASTDQSSLVWFILSMNFLLAFLCVLGILLLLALDLWRGNQPAPVSLQRYEHIPDGPEDEVE